MIFNIIFDNIYVLNLKNSNDRKTHIENEFSRVGINKYEFFEATPHDSDEVKNLIKSNFVKKFPNCFRCNQKRCDCENNFLTEFQIGNWCSFINIFNDIIKKNYKFVLICEDDIVFSFQYKRIINRLLSKENFNKYKIDMNKPLLIRMGTAFNPQNHNDTNTQPFFLRNYALSNPCFAINKEMAIIYLKYLKIIDYHSDIYFHSKIPKNIKGIQHFTMYPYPIYELSFVKSKQKFESLIRPLNAIRRKEYKEFLFISTNSLLNIFLKNLFKNNILNIGTDKIGFNGSIDHYLLLSEHDKSKYYFEFKFQLIDNHYDDIRIIYYNIIKNNIYIKDYYEKYIKKIKEVLNIELKIENNDKLLENVINFYNYYLKLIEQENPVKININSDIIDLSKKLKINNIKNHLQNYNLYKKLLIDNCDITNEMIDLLYDHK